MFDESLEDHKRNTIINKINWNSLPLRTRQLPRNEIKKFKTALKITSINLRINAGRDKFMFNESLEDHKRNTIINKNELNVVNDFTYRSYLGSTISDNLSLQKELDKRIGKAATTFARLNARVWKISKLTIKTKVAVYNACVLSKLLYGSETWTTYSDQEKRLNAFHLRSLRRLLGISWMNKIPNTVVLSHTELPSMYTLLRQRRLRWLGHVRRMDDGRIPKDILYGELAEEKEALDAPNYVSVMFVNGT